MVISDHKDLHVLIPRLVLHGTSLSEGRKFVFVSLADRLRMSPSPLRNEAYQLLAPCLSLVSDWLNQHDPNMNATSMILCDEPAVITSYSLSPSLLCIDDLVHVLPLQ